MMVLPESTSAGTGCPFSQRVMVGVLDWEVLYTAHPASQGLLTWESAGCLGSVGISLSGGEGRCQLLVCAPLWASGAGVGWVQVSRPKLCTGLLLSPLLISKVAKVHSRAETMAHVIAVIFIPTVFHSSSGSDQRNRLIVMHSTITTGVSWSGWGHHWVIHRSASI